eukprot:Nk52_evm1s2042 gene=Nk52_evmTU1s2042
MGTPYDTRFELSRFLQEEDGVTTKSSREQEKVEESIEYYYERCRLQPESQNHVNLTRGLHENFCRAGLRQLSENYECLDCNRPWLVYWITHALSILHHGATGGAVAAADTTAKKKKKINNNQDNNNNRSGYLSEKERLSVLCLLERCQNKGGGFGGGPGGQMSHLAPTYAAVCSLVELSSPGKGGDECLDLVDRGAMWRWLMSLKQKKEEKEEGGGEENKEGFYYEGSFSMHEGGEIDVRACYCAIAVAKMLGIDGWRVGDVEEYERRRRNNKRDEKEDKEQQEEGEEEEELFSGTAEWLSRCQTYEGGMGGEPGLEAHGGYAFCGLAGVVLLDRVDVIDVEMMLDWASQRQMRFEGGFQGRTNKLVDGCYSFWLGGMFPLLDYALRRRKKMEMMKDDDDEKKKRRRRDSCSLPSTVSSSSMSGGGGDGGGIYRWLFNQRALQEYILICCQFQFGGLIDKPGKNRDFYHTCYVLSGLSVTQHGDKEAGMMLGGGGNAVGSVDACVNVCPAGKAGDVRRYYMEEDKRKRRMEEEGGEEEEEEEEGK